MRTRTSLSALAVACLAMLCAAPALAGPRTPTTQALPDSPSEGRGADSELPVDGRPVVATVIEVDEDEGMVTLSTPHGPVSLAVAPDIAARLTVGDVVVVRFTEDEEEWPAASPRTEPTPGTLAPEALRHINKGDNVTIDLTITPLGAPAASPATR